MPRDKDGNQLTWKEFMVRWKQGIEGITPLQQSRMSYNSTWIMLIGIIAGIVICLLNVKELWWLLIILMGAFFNTSIVQLGNWQKMRLLQRMYNGT